MIRYLFQDVAVNRGNWLSVLLLVQLRAIAWLLRYRSFGVFLSAPFWAAYKVYSMLLLNCEVSPRTVIGPRLRLPHPYGVIINVKSVIGGDCLIRHNVTIGNKGDHAPDDCPVIRDFVEFGCGASVIGPVCIGLGAKIGAGAVVTRDVPAGAVCVGSRSTIL